MRFLVAVLVSVCVMSPASAAVTLDAPTSVAAGAPFEVRFSGSENGRDFITIVAPDLPEGKYSAYKYARDKGVVQMVAPDEAGTYELRYLAANSPYPTLARSPLEVTPVTATVKTAESSAAGSPLIVEWTGPDHPRDFITVVKAGTPEKKYGPYKYTKRGNPTELKTPEEPGEYEVRYLTGQKYYTLASAGFTVQGTTAELTVPDTVGAGDAFDVHWKGPDNERDWIALTNVGSEPGEYRMYRYTNRGNPVQLRAPDEPGTYEVRYMTSGYNMLASTEIKVGDISASLSGPEEVVGGEPFQVGWEGPDRAQDYIEIIKQDDPQERYTDYAYTDRGNPAELLAALVPGDYVLRYRTGQSGRVLATRAIRITPPKTQPGELLVQAAESFDRIPDDGAVEIILDASGSMLKKQGGKRRIEIAREVLLGLTAETLPAGTPFAMRVFGHKEKDSCRTDLEIPLSPLDVSAAQGKIRGVQAMNLAKTPIADSLARVGSDLAGVTGPKLIVLITDGEETCGGDPAAAIESLKEAGIDVRVNIVGFAIEDDALKNAFRYWAELGGGDYHDADGAEALGTSLRRALQTPFDVIDAEGKVVAQGIAGGARIELLPGKYRVRTRDKASLEFPVEIEPGERTVLTMESK